MRLVDKYLLRLFLAPLFYCLFAFISVYIIVDLFGHLDEIIKEGVGLVTLATYYLAYCPTIFVQVTPIALLISTMYTLGGLVRHNEIVALRASGISVWNALKPFLLAGLFASCLILILNDRVVPFTSSVFLRIKEEKIERKHDQRASAPVIRNVALYGAGNKIIYARFYDPKIKLLKDIIIHEHDRRQNIMSKTTAKEAKWTKNGWAAFSITAYKLDRQGQISEEPRFQHRGILDIKETPGDFQAQKYKTQVLSLSELRHYIKRLSGSSGLILQNLRVEAYSRVSYPFANIIAVIIGAAFSLRAKRGGRLFGLGMGFLIGFLFYGVFAVSIALGKGGLLPPLIAAWLSNALFGLLGVYMINRY